MRVLSCNVRTSTAQDGDNNWVRRKQICVGVIRAQNPDIVCCQEVNGDQFADLSQGLPEFDSFGTADEATSANPVDAIFFRRAMFRRVSAGAYWLSQTPHVPGSSSWDSRCIRLCNWLRLVELSSGHELRVANTHLDHVSQTARLNQARLINEDAAAYAATYPQILTGDMNCTAQNEVIASFRAAGWTDSYEAVHGNSYAGNTFHAFLGPAFSFEQGKIDWIFVRGDARALAGSIVTEAVNGCYPSDHYFLSADVMLSAPRNL